MSYYNQERDGTGVERLVVVVVVAAAAEGSSEVG
jgi:hypothetical protein